MLKHFGRYLAFVTSICLLLGLFTACGDTSPMAGVTATSGAVTTLATITTANATSAAVNPTVAAATANVTTVGAVTTTAGGTPSNNTAAACVAPIAAAASAQLKIGIALQVNIPPFKAAIDGFQKGLASCGFVEGKNVTYDLKDGQGDIPTLATIGQQFHDKKLDLILAVGSGALIQMYNANKDGSIPIVFGSVADPYSALPDTIKSPTDHAFITGVQTYPPVEQALQTLKQFLPNAKKIGIVSNTSEVNSKFAVNLIKQQGEPLGYEISVKGISKADEVLSASQALATEKVDVFLAQADNTVSNAFESMVQVSLASKIPILAMDVGYGPRGAEVSLGLDYFVNGTSVARQTAQIFGGTKINTIPIEVQKSTNIVVNNKAATLIGIPIPDAILGVAIQKYDAITPPKK